MSEELKPCPFCGGPVKLEKAHQRRHEHFGMRQFWGVVCRNTSNLGGTCCMEQVPSASPEAAIERWNRRATPPSPSTAQDIAREAMTKWDSMPDAKMPSPSTASEVGELPPLPRELRELIECENAGTTNRVIELIEGYARAALAAKPAAREVDVEAERKLFEAEFEAWWQAHGQYCRAGGGDYEKTFAYRAAEYFARRTQVPAQTGSGEEGKDAASTAAEENERIAELFHRTYEELAPSFGYETRPESRKPWHEVPKANRLLMTAVVAKVRTALAYRYPQEGDRQVDRGERYRVHPVGELFEPQMRYCAGATGEWFWAPLNKDGYWLEPECFSYGKVTKHEPMTYEEAERAVVCARRINEEQLLSLAAIAATQSEEQRG